MKSQGERIWTASDFAWAVALDDRLQAHGLYVSHCGHWEVLAWPCPTAARLLDELGAPRPGVDRPA